MWYPGLNFNNFKFKTSKIQNSTPRDLQFSLSKWYVQALQDIENHLLNIVNIVSLLYTHKQLLTHSFLNLCSLMTIGTRTDRSPLVRFNPFSCDGQAVSLVNKLTRIRLCPSQLCFILWIYTIPSSSTGLAGIIWIRGHTRPHWTIIQDYAALPLACPLTRASQHFFTVK